MADPTSKYRWYRYGEPWGLLERTNVRAAAWSVARRAITTAVWITSLYALVIYFGGQTNHWQIKLSICALLGALIGALCEWQICDDELPEEVEQ